MGGNDLQSHDLGRNPVDLGTLERVRRCRLSLGNHAQQGKKGDEKAFHLRRRYRDRSEPRPSPEANNPA